MRIHPRTLIIATAIVLAGCANNQPAPESSATTTPSSIPVADGSTPNQPAPDEVAARVVGRAQDLMYATNDEIQTLIALDTTNNGNRALNEIVRQQLVPLRAALNEAPPATTWYAVRPLSTTIEEQTDTTAKVSVWSIEVFSRQGFVNPETWWWLTDIELVNQDGQWLVDTYTQRPGPVAANGADHWPTTAADLDLQLDEHALLTATGTRQ